MIRIKFANATASLLNIAAAVVDIVLTTFMTKFYLVAGNYIDMVPPTRSIRMNLKNQ